MYGYMYLSQGGGWLGAYYAISPLIDVEKIRKNTYINAVSAGMYLCVYMYT